MPGPGRGGLAFAIFTLVRLTRNSGACNWVALREENVMRKARVAAVTATLIAVLAIGIAGAEGGDHRSGGDGPEDRGRGEPAGSAEGPARAGDDPRQRLAADDRRQPPAGVEGSRSSTPIRTWSSTSRACRPAGSASCEAVTTRRAEAVCGDAIVGRGSATVEVVFPEQAPIRSTGPLLIFNGGERNGAITFIGHAYVSVPAPTAVVGTAKVTRVKKGAFGLHVTVDVPEIAGGAGSVVKAGLRLGPHLHLQGQAPQRLLGQVQKRPHRGAGDVQVRRRILAFGWVPGSLHRYRLTAARSSRRLRPLRGPARAAARLRRPASPGSPPAGGTARGRARAGRRGRGRRRGRPAAPLGRPGRRGR